MGGVLLQLPSWARVTAKRRGHIDRVGELIATWAREIGVSDAERGRWLRAVSMHDALKDAPKELLRELAPDPWDTDSLRHGPAAAVLAARNGETDRGVLDAVRYHSVGYAAWDAVGRMLYLADYLEPGRSRNREAQRRLAARVCEDVAGVLREVARQRIGRIIAAGHPLLPETIAFWNSLACDE
ncbi:MAG: HD domain-containing protein [Gemmatimonadales bacterium]|nr:HD domain-containing protein [Gemmatimonadales bacterium]NIN12477.1 HD domain-containing protein [Gemmatimonadales bacterium]NIN50853.1 HD domain-containing protein [Gemmatimonadales bacterium]NIP08317.1 HD domain-containing protein [Gemmatimonadales bacterium]NIR00841.1 HD domain-containing protein [Gemmatimonadales bacterium]